MSAILIHATHRRAYVLSDMGEWNAEGALVGLRSKLHSLSGCTGVLVTRGSVRASEALQEASSDSRFDDCVSELPDRLRALSDSLEAFLVGASERTGLVEAWFCSTNSRHAPAYTMKRFFRMMSPRVEKLPTAFTPELEGRRIFEAMRRTPATWSGRKMIVAAGGVDLACITPVGVALQPLDRWDDAPVQVTSPDRYAIEAEEANFDAEPLDLTNRTVFVETTRLGVNMKTLHDDVYPEATEEDILVGVSLTCTINGGVMVGGPGADSAYVRTPVAFDVDAGWPVAIVTGNTTNGQPEITNISEDVTNLKEGTPISGTGIPAGARVLSVDSSSQITLDVNATASNTGVSLSLYFHLTLQVIGRIQGVSGRGGDGTASGSTAIGRPGRTALYTRYPIVLVDADGEVFGGGGGGGAYRYTTGKSVGGGSGAGFEAGLPGSSQPAENYIPPTAGTTDTPGAGGTNGPFGLQSGDGGGPGLAGETPSIPPVAGVGYAGGAAGYAIDGISYVTQSGSPGDRRGDEVN